MKSLSQYGTVNINTESPRVKVTLLIGKSLLTAIEGHLAQKNLSMGAFLKLLVADYAKLLTSKYYRSFLPSSNRIFTRYQKRGQDLQQVTPRVSPEDWALLGNMALAMGSARCLIFSHLARIRIFGASNILPTPQMQRTYWRTLAKKCLARLHVERFLDLPEMILSRQHRWELGDLKEEFYKNNIDSA